MYKWIDFNLSSDSKDCPKCVKKGISETLTINTEENSWFCKCCGFAGDLFKGTQQIPKCGTTLLPWSYNPNIESFNLDEPIPNSLCEKFKTKRISEKTLAKFKVNQSKVYFPELNKILNCIVFPYYLDHQISNLVYFHGNNRHSEIGGVECCFNYDNINKEHTYFLLDELEVFTFEEIGISNSISLFGGNSFTETEGELKLGSKLDFLQNIEQKLNDVKKITIALPNTDNGNIIKDELIRRIGKEKCWVVQPPERGYSWNDVFVEYGKTKTLHLLETEKPIPVRGIFEIDDIEEKFDELYFKGLKRGAQTGFPTLNEHYTVVPGQWTVVTGIPGHGKSNFLDALLVNLAKYENWNFAIFSPENQPLERHYANIMEKYWGAPFDVDKRGRITEDQKEEGKIWLKKHFSVILPHEEDSWSIDGVLSLAKVLVFRKGIKGLVIDPWNELDHSRPNNQTETEYISSVLTKIRQFARNYHVHVWLVAHPAKLYKDKDGKYPVPTPYDISGSAHYRNKADNAITVWRNVGHDDQAVTDIHVQKIRFKEVGRVGLVSLRYEPISGMFIDDIDQDRRKKALEDGEIIQTDRLIRRF